MVTSLSEYLKSIKQDNSVKARAKLAVKYGLVKSEQDYINLANKGQNTAINSKILVSMQNEGAKTTSTNPQTGSSYVSPYSSIVPPVTSPTNELSSALNVQSKTTGDIGKMPTPSNFSILNQDVSKLSIPVTSSYVAPTTPVAPAAPVVATAATPTKPSTKETAPIVPLITPMATIDGTGQPVFRGDNTLIKFATDPDGNGPLTSNTIWYVDKITKTIRPFLSDAAFTIKMGKTPQQLTPDEFAVVPTSVLDTGGMFATYDLLEDKYGVKDDGTVVDKVSPSVDTDKISTRYGQEVSPENNKEAFRELVGVLGLLKADTNSGVSQSLIDEISKDQNAMGLYINALAYGGYKLSDIMRDLKRRELIKNGDATLSGVKIIDESVNAPDYYKTPQGTAAQSNPSLTPPATISNVDSKLFDSVIFKIDPSLYNILVKPFNPNTPEGKAEMDKIKSIYNDIVDKQISATNDRESALADYSWNQFRNDLNRKYNIQLSSNAAEAWNQISQIGSTMSERGIYQSGLANEAVDKYLQKIRKNDQINRESKLTEEQSAKQNHLLKYGTPEEIAQLSDQEKIDLGFKPSADVQQFLSIENLRKLYPDLSDEKLMNYRNTILDASGNYLSESMGKMYSNKLANIQDKTAFQESQVIAQKSTAEEQAYRPYSTSVPFSKDVTTPVTPAPVTSAPVVPTVSTPAVYKGEPLISTSPVYKGESLILQPLSMNTDQFSRDFEIKKGRAPTQKEILDYANTRNKV